MSDDIVKFHMPDGSEVSNDPRWLAQQAADAANQLLDSVPNTGNAGIPDEEMRAQLGGGLAPGQSGQPGVGESPTATVEEMTAGKVTGAVMQTSDAETARERGADPVNPAVTPPEPKDSNEEVLKTRESKSEGFEGMTAKELKAEADARGVDYSGVTKKSELVALLRNSESTATK